MEDVVRELGKIKRQRELVRSSIIATAAKEKLLAELDEAERKLASSIVDVSEKGVVPPVVKGK